MTTRRARPRRHLRLLVAVFLLADAAVLGTDVFLLTNRSTTTTVDLGDALRTFRSSGTADGPSAVAASSGDAPTTEAPAPVTAVTEVTRTTGAAPGTTATAGAPVVPATAPAGTPVPPSEGVYAYRTAGGESISVLGAHHDYPATTYAVVRQTGGCGWDIRAEVVEEHVDERTMCSGDGDILQLTQSRLVTFFGTTDGATFTCNPPQRQLHVGDAVGARSEGDCGDGKGSTAHLARTILGYGTATVGGVRVDVVRIVVEGTITGRVRGTSHDLLTLVAGTGLPIRWERSVDTLADAFGSTVRYQEQAQFDLASLTPQT